MTREELEQLLARCEAATGPDRAIDSEVVRLFVGADEAELHKKYSMRHHDYTSSLDAIIGLIERELPGLVWNAKGGAEPHIDRLVCGLSRSTPEYTITNYWRGHNYALALCHAFVKAKIDHMFPAKLQPLQEGR